MVSIISAEIWKVITLQVQQNHYLKLGVSIDETNLVWAWIWTCRTFYSPKIVKSATQFATNLEKLPQHQPSQLLAAPRLNPRPGLRWGSWLRQLTWAFAAGAGAADNFDLSHDVQHTARAGVHHLDLDLDLALEGFLYLVLVLDLSILCLSLVVQKMWKEIDSQKSKQITKVIYACE